MTEESNRVAVTSADPGAALKGGLDTGDRTWTHWLCNLHGVKGRNDDGSLTDHQDAAHGGQQTTVTFGHQDVGV